MLPLFDIFSGHFLRKDAMWIEACRGAAGAIQRMLEIAAKQPGHTSCTAATRVDA